MKNIPRCPWAGSDPVYCNYHDNEWGIAVHDDKKLFEMLILEGFQAGLSWITILKRRKQFSLAFSDWDWNTISRYVTEDVHRLMQDSGIIRNRLKIESTINNAKQFIKIRKEFKSFNNYFWHFSDNKIITPEFPYVTLQEVPCKTALSDSISKDLKNRGFSFVGSIICYSFMQAVGMVNDHIADCYKSILA